MGAVSAKTSAASLPASQAEKWGKRKAWFFLPPPSLHFANPSTPQWHDQSPPCSLQPYTPRWYHAWRSDRSRKLPSLKSFLPAQSMAPAKKEKMAKSVAETIKISPLQCKPTPLVYHLSSQVNWTAEKIMRPLCFRVTRCSSCREQAPALDRTIWQLTHHSLGFSHSASNSFVGDETERGSPITRTEDIGTSTQWCLFSSKSAVISQKQAAPRPMLKAAVVGCAGQRWDTKQFSPSTTAQDSLSWSFCYSAFHTTDCKGLCKSVCS